MKPSRTIFVTGATGFLGGHFLRIATNQNWQLRCLSRKPPKVRSRHVEWVKGDLVQDGAWNCKLKGCDTMVHLATASLLDCEKDPLMGFHVIVNGFITFIQNAMDRGVQRIILASTAEVYGASSRVPLKEGVAPLRPISIYGFLKACVDLYALEKAQENPFSVCILRFFNLYGRAVDGSLPTSVLRIFSERILKGEPVVLHRSYRNSRDFIHVKDAARALLLAIRNNQATGVIHVASERETRLRDAAQKLARLAGRKLVIDFRPKEGRLRAMVADCQRAHRLLKFYPKVSLEQGLRDVLEGISTANCSHQKK